ncbi:MAG: phosphatase [Tractidigestivibacter sp.]|jgi:putative hydrolase|uniref:phosphatase n=1 Tax=Tractidigestivibacter sp. TaxID=2847320 RepID=UPI003D94C71F
MTSSNSRKIACDVHTHTLFSRHAYSTLEEDVRAASEQGMELLGVTDHFSSMLFSEQTIQNWQYFMNLWAWPREWHGVKLLRGCEADIVDLDGQLFGHDIVFREATTGGKLARPITLKDMAFRQCDYVIASVHDKRFTQGVSRAKITEMYLKVLADPKVLILGHVGRTGLDFDLNEVLLAAKERGKLIEINESSLIAQKRAGSIDNCRRIAERCAELGVSISFGSDSHVASLVGHHEATDELLAEVDFPAELIACRDAQAFTSFVETAIGPMRP